MPNVDVDSLTLQITADAQNATKGLDALINTLDRLKKATSGGCGLGKVSTEMTKLKNVNIGLSSANSNSAKSFTNLATKALVTYHSLKKIGTVIASWITESNNYVENLNLFTVAMGEYAKSAQEYAEHVGEVMGIDPSEWMRNQGVFMTLATGFGVAGDRAAVMSQQLTQLGYDISSFYNISVADAMQKLQSGVSGELEPLRRLGYDLSQAKLAATALSLGIEKSVNKMTQAEKAQLRYYAIMTQVTEAQGDMSRTLEAPANQLRIMKAQLTQAARALGNIFIPALNAVLPYAIAAVKVIRLLANAIANLVGFTLPEVDYSGVNSGVTDTSDNLEDATESAKKFKNMLLGIDELNVLSDKDKDDEDGAGAFDFELPTYDFIGEATNSKINQIVEEMKEWLGITGDINSWADLMDTRFGSILKTVGLIGGAFLAWKLTKGFLDSIKVVQAIIANPALSLVISATLVLAGITLALGGFKDAIAEGLDGTNFGEIVGGSILTAGGAAALGSKIVTWIGKVCGPKVAFALARMGTNLGLTTTGALGAALGASIVGIVAGIPMYFVGIRDAIKDGIDWLNSFLVGAGATAAGAGIGALIGMLGGPIGAGVGALIGLVVGLVTDLTILIVQKWDVISAWFQQSFAVIGQFFVNVWDGIVSVWNTVATWFDTYVIQPVVGFFVGLWTGISSAASACWNAIVEFFSPAFEWFAALFGSIWQTISDIFYNIGVLASGCWEIIKAVWAIVSEWFNKHVCKPVGDFFKGVWSSVSGWAIDAWDAIKTAFSKIGNWINTNVVSPVSKFFSNLWNGFLDKARSAWDGVKSVFSKVGSFFSETFSKAWAGIVKVFSVAGDIFVDIKDGIVSAFKVVVNEIIKGLNKVVSIPFKGINSALMWIKNLEILGLKPFSSLKEINIPQIPLLASGGMVDAGQMFIAREAGPEMVGSIGNRTAVANNDQIVESVSKGVYQAVVSAMGQSGGNQVVEAKVNDKVLFEVVVSRNRQETMRTGHSPLLGGV